MIVARNIHLWAQDPVKTEERSYFSLLKTLELGSDAAYVAYPWAACLNGLGSLDEAPIVPPDFGGVAFTICQHVRYRELIPRFEKMGIDVVFTPHALEDERESDGVKVLGYPHWPANFSDPDSTGGGGAEYLFSFVGAANAAVRRDIFAKLDGCENGFLKVRGNWHFDADEEVQLARKEEYERVLASSEFVLCPRGVGPSSLRIWEAFASGKIPVIIADDLQMPDGVDWDGCSVRVLEYEVASLPEKLSQIGGDELEKLRAGAREVGRKLAGDFTFAVEAWVAPRRVKASMTTGERELIKSLLAPEHKVLEWGAGDSTLKFYRLVSRYASIEHDADLYERVKERIRSDDVFLIETEDGGEPGDPEVFADYISFPAALDEQFDFVLIGGKCRVECAAQVLKSSLLAKDGLVIVLDWSTERYHKILDWYEVADEFRPEHTEDEDIAILRPKQGARTEMAEPESGEPDGAIVWVSESDGFGLGDRLRGSRPGRCSPKC